MIPDEEEINSENQNLITEQLKKMDKKEFTSYLSKDFIDSVSKMKIEDFRELYLINPEKIDEYISIDKIISIIEGEDCTITKFDTTTFYYKVFNGKVYSINRFELANKCISFMINKGFDIQYFYKKNNDFMPHISIFIYNREVFEQIGYCQAELTFDAFRFAYNYGTLRD